MQFKNDLCPFKYFIYTQLLLNFATGQNYNTHQTNHEINLYNFEDAIMERCVVWVSILHKLITHYIIGIGFIYTLLEILLFARSYL